MENHKLLLATIFLFAIAVGIYFLLGYEARKTEILQTEGTTITAQFIASDHDPEEVKISVGRRARKKRAIYYIEYTFNNKSYESSLIGLNASKERKDYRNGNMEKRVPGEEIEIIIDPNRPHEAHTIEYAMNGASRQTTGWVFLIAMVLGGIGTGIAYVVALRD